MTSPVVTVGNSILSRSVGPSDCFANQKSDDSCCLVMLTVVSYASQATRTGNIIELINAGYFKGSLSISLIEACMSEAF